MLAAGTSVDYMRARGASEEAEQNNCRKISKLT